MPRARVVSSMPKTWCFTPHGTAGAWGAQTEELALNFTHVLYHPRLVKRQRGPVWWEKSASKMFGNRNQSKNSRGGKCHRCWFSGPVVAVGLLLAWRHLPNPRSTCALRPTGCTSTAGFTSILHLLSFRVRVFDLRKSEPLCSLYAHQLGVSAVQMDDWKIVSGGEEGLVCVWDQRMGTKLWEMHAR